MQIADKLVAQFPNTFPKRVLNIILLANEKILCIPLFVLHLYDNRKIFLQDLHFDVFQLGNLFLKFCIRKAGRFLFFKIAKKYCINIVTHKFIDSPVHDLVRVLNIIPTNPIPFFQQCRVAVISEFITNLCERVNNDIRIFG